MTDLGKFREDKLSRMNCFGHLAKVSPFKVGQVPKSGQLQLADNFLHRCALIRASTVYVYKTARDKRQLSIIRSTLLLLQLAVVLLKLIPQQTNLNILRQ